MQPSHDCRRLRAQAGDVANGRGAGSRGAAVKTRQRRSDGQLAARCNGLGQCHGDSSGRCGGNRDPRLSESGFKLEATLSCSWPGPGPE